MIKEFRDFVNRGNVMDLAVAVIIGAAFGAIVNSVVNDIIMPIIGIIFGGVDFTALAIQVGEESITYGNFIQAVVNFLLVAFTVFLIVRAYNRLQKEEEEPETKQEAPPEPSAEVQLLTEIRDLLRQQSK
ncbi:MAG: large-conductance mechanosensitive channel protein MscL [Candidatus Promineifilaceae bacterium]|nr:large-conductance mechanosensitive channel protein MscL [Candidatus Promineifilaceae bacterium]